MNSEPTIRQATASDRPKLKEIIGLSFPRFFRFFASHSVTQKREKCLSPKLKAQSQGLLSLSNSTSAQASMAVFSGLPLILPYGAGELLSA